MGLDRVLRIQFPKGAFLGAPMTRNRVYLGAYGLV